MTQPKITRREARFIVQQWCEHCASQIIEEDAEALVRMIERKLDQYAEKVRTK